MSEFAIVRTEKKSRLGDIRGLAGHHLRSDDVPNADPERGIVILRGPAHANEVTALFKQRTDPLAKRKDAVRCIDVFCGMSPEWAASNPNRIDEWTKRTAEWITAYFGEENIISLVRHDDETSPHISALCSPVVKGKLQAKNWLGGKDKMRAMQQSYADAMQPLGLKRGVKGSRAKHEKIQRWYGELEPRMEAAQEVIAQADDVRAELAQQAAKNKKRFESITKYEKSARSRAKLLDAEKAQLEIERAEVALQKNALSRLANDLREKVSKLDQVWDMLPAGVQKMVSAVFGKVIDEERERRECKRMEHSERPKGRRFIAPKPRM